MNLVWVALLGGLAGSDATAVAQTMVSRPFIAGTLVGVLAGRPQEGLILGAILELFALVILPVGAAKYPESSTAAVVAGAAYMSATQVMSPAVMLLAVLLALVWERFAGYTVNLTRRFNEQHVALAALATSHPDRELERRHMTAIAVDFMRAALITLGGAFAGGVVLRTLAGMWSMDAAIAPAILSIGVSCMIGAALPLFGGLQARKIALLVGVLLGSLLVFTR